MGNLRVVPLDMLRDSEEKLLVKLRSGDETAFSTLFDELNSRLYGLARTFSSSPALAEDIVQETWLAVIRGLRGFEGRSSLRTWIFSILVRRARTMSAREVRRGGVVMPSNLAANGSSIEWEPGLGRVGLWEESPKPWHLDDPASVLQSRELIEVLERALESLPGLQRQVVLLRDVEDVPSTEVCNVLGITETNQRVLLHRGRARVRKALDRYLRDDSNTPARSPSGAARTTAGRPVASSPPDGSEPAHK
jgi:RNA polymerase sigma-70 factor (ECF subfamily)